MAKRAAGEDVASIEQVVGENLTRLRMRRGWTQEQLGERVGEITGKKWARAVVSTAESGDRSFTIADLMALAYVFEVSLEAFIVMGPDVKKVRIGPTTKARADLEPISWQASPAGSGYSEILESAALMHDELEQLFDIADRAQRRGTHITTELLRLRQATRLKALGADRAADYDRDNGGDR